MARTWQQARDDARADGRLDEARIAEHRDRLQGEVLAHRLAEIRKAQRLSQQEVADAMGITQSRVSRIESGDISRSELATLRAYIHALGGHVRLVADFREQQVTVRLCGTCDS